ncbi:MAG TPA: nuclear transport factor 2 family protein [Kofleriaceae bacterium]|nr:nuclear transport factor 2 family protein [Kofleriaceae bacterium]
MTMTSTTKNPTSAREELQELEERRRQAELRGDAAALDALSTDDLRLVGPVGFVIDKKQWLDGYRSGALVVESLTWDEVEVREYGDTAVAIGLQTQEAAYRGAPAAGRFRVTHVAVRRDGRWLLAGLHFSPVAAPPGPPAR